MGKLTGSYTRDFLIPGDDRGQTVAYTPLGATAAFLVAAAIHEDQTVMEEGAEGGLYGEGEERWTMGKAEFDRQAVTPTQGDSFTDEAEQLWTVTGPIDLDPLELVYGLACKRGRVSG